MNEQEQPSTEKQPRVLDYAVPGERESRWMPTVILILVVLGIMALLVAIIMPMLGQSREPAHRIICANNLRTIGQRCLEYAENNAGRFPADLALLIQYQEMSSEMFVCPSFYHEKAEGATKQEILANFAKPGHCSYVYLGNGLTLSSPKTALVAYDMVRNHDREGLNVLYADGTVNWLGRKQAISLIPELDADYKPPATPQSRPATQPAKP